MTWSLGFLLISIVFLVILFATVILLSPRIRRRLRNVGLYEDNLHIVVLFRQILLFFAPLAISIIFFGIDFSSTQLLSLLLLGLSITVFWGVQLPTLMNANIDVTCVVTERKDEPEIVLKGEERLFNTRIYNLGFSTLKNSTVELYFGKNFKVIPPDDIRYKGLDFAKHFTIQKPRYCKSETLAIEKQKKLGTEEVLFAPSLNFQTIPPQESINLPCIVQVLKPQDLHEVTVEFFSESSWGKKVIKVSLKLSE